MDDEQDDQTIISERRGAVTRIELNRPGAANAWTPQMGLALKRALDQAGGDPSVRAILITGRGRVFSAGADVKVERELTPAGEPDLSSRLREIYNPVITAVRRAPKPVIAAVNGPAAGLGCSLALACDLILASEDAFFLYAFIRLGLIPDAGATYLAAVRIGYSRAAELAMLGERLPARRALEWGLINAVHPADELVEQAASLAARLAAGPTVAYANLKRALDAGSLAALPTQLEFEPTLQQLHATTHDYAEGVRAFREGREPEFRGS